MRPFVLICLILMLTGYRVESQCNIDCIKKLWVNRNYPEVISKGGMLRDSLSGKGIPALDYMIVSSICMQPPDKSKGCDLFKLMTDDYYQGINTTDLNLMRQEYISICTNNNKPDLSVLTRFHHQQFIDAVSPTAGFYGHGKSFILMKDGLEGYIKNPMKTMEGLSESSGMKSPMPLSYNIDQVNYFKNQRVKTINQEKIARLAFRFSPQARYFISEHFICIGKGKSGELETTAKELEKAYSYFIHYFDFKPPDSYITVYIVSQSEQMSSAILRIYKDHVNRYVLGYSNIYDNSMMAWIPGWELVGTFKHELIHLLIKSQFSHLPVWFEEGLASLYEESRYNPDDQLLGINNWRLSLVQENLFNLDLDDIFFMRSAERDSILQGEIERQSDKFYQLVEAQSHSDPLSSMHEIFMESKTDMKNTIPKFFETYLHANEDALMRYFILYLQQNNKLKPMYTAFLQREKNMYIPDGYKTNRSIILETCGFDNIADLNNNFRQWVSLQKLD